MFEGLFKKKIKQLEGSMNQSERQEYNKGKRIGTAIGVAAVLGAAGADVVMTPKVSDMPERKIEHVQQASPQEMDKLNKKIKPPKVASESEMSLQE